MEDADPYRTLCETDARIVVLRVDGNQVWFNSEKIPITQAASVARSIMLTRAEKVLYIEENDAFSMSALLSEIRRSIPGVMFYRIPKGFLEGNPCSQEGAS
jgi:hypothetical protein